MARCARPARLVLHPTPAKPRKLGRKPALVSSLSRLASLLGGGGSPERTGLVPSLRLLPLVGRPENSRDFVRRGWNKWEFAGVRRSWEPSGNPRLTAPGVRRVGVDEPELARLFTAKGVVGEALVD